MTTLLTRGAEQVERQRRTAAAMKLGRQLLLG
jgi:hypothetical protein